MEPANKMRAKRSMAILLTLGVPSFVVPCWMRRVIKWGAEANTAKQASHALCTEGLS
jgi:hypothetical protein